MHKWDSSHESSSKLWLFHPFHRVLEGPLMTCSVYVAIIIMYAHYEIAFLSRTMKFEYGQVFSYEQEKMKRLIINEHVGVLLWSFCWTAQRLLHFDLVLSCFETTTRKNLKSTNLFVTVLIFSFQIGNYFLNWMKIIIKLLFE